MPAAAVDYDVGCCFCVGFLAGNKNRKNMKTNKIHGRVDVMMLTFIFAAIQKNLDKALLLLLLLSTARILSLAGMNHQIYIHPHQKACTRHRSAISSNENEWPWVVNCLDFY